MVPKKITSLQHPLVQHWLRLRLDRTYREEVQRVFVSGEKIVKEQRVEVLITIEPSEVSAKEKYLVTDSILKKITGLNQPDGFAAEIALPPPQNLQNKELLLILDQISDPGNLGTLIRTALALNWEGVILTPKTVDLFNDKVIRAAKGANFCLPYARMNLEEITAMKTHFYTADLEGTPIDEIHFKGPRALILSNEARGPGDWSDRIGQKLTIPMNGKIDSLNVAISGAILMYAMRGC